MNPPAKPHYGLILAGGESKRMGQDKAHLVLPQTGETLLARTIRLLSEVGLTPVVVGRPAPQTQGQGPVVYLPDDPPEPHRGPLVGLKTALCHLRAPVLALACDMPLLTDELLRFVLSQSDSCGKHGLVLSKEQPLCGIYQPSCVPLLVELLQREKRRERSLRQLMAVGDFAEVPAPAELLSQLRSANTPSDFAELVGRTC